MIEEWTSISWLLQMEIWLTRLPSIWLMAALSLSVHSATTFALISFMYNMKAFRGFLMCGFFLSEDNNNTS